MTWKLELTATDREFEGGWVCAKRLVQTCRPDSQYAQYRTTTLAILDSLLPSLGGGLIGVRPERGEGED